ncbi:MAG: TRAP transporter small permease subunit [Roseovarius sp.]
MLRLFEILIEWIGRVTALLVFVLMAILLYGVVARYLLDSPTSWTSELSGMLYACYFLLGGSYALMKSEHVSVNILRDRLGRRTGAAVDLFTWTFFYIFIGVIFWLGLDYAQSSIARLERSHTVWRPYIWPIKLMLPLSALLMLLAALRKTLGDLRIVLGKDGPDVQ